jgi:hypothetical protein
MPQRQWRLLCFSSPTNLSSGFGHLRVDEQFADEQPFGTWNTEWARALHRSSRLEVREASWEQA